MTNKLADIVDHPERTGEIPIEAIPPLLAQLAAAQSALAARLLSSASNRLGDGGKIPADQGHAEQLMTVAEAATQLALKPAYVYELVRQVLLPAVRQGKYIRIRCADLRSWIMQHRKKAIDML
jgi:excisionase family DNA binding protein